MSTTPKKSISIAVLLSLTIAVVSTLLLLAIVWWWLDSETFETLPIRFVCGSGANVVGRPRRQATQMFL